MLNKYILTFSALLVTTQALSSPEHWYANKDSYIKNSPLASSSNAGNLHWGESVIVVDSTSHEGWLEVKTTCTKEQIGWVQKDYLVPSSQFVKASNWQIKKYAFETASGDYGVETKIEFDRAGKAILLIQELGDGISPKPLKRECSTFITGSLAQLRCGNNSDIVQTIQFDLKNGNLLNLPCPIGGPSESYITEYKKFKFSEFPTNEAASQINLWLNSNVIGNDNDGAKFSTVRIIENDNRYTAKFKSQFEFTCDLEFDALGMPYILKSCTSSVYKYSEPDAEVYLTCRSNEKETTCTGPWKKVNPWSRRSSYNSSMRFALVMKH